MWPVLYLNEVVTKSYKIKYFGLPLELMFAAAEHDFSLPTLFAVFRVNMFIN